ncbi:hypothetical protein ACFSO7_21705 [Bacillus sp. CGMCC 1.16607]|uniref:hypothetical protein n=1 Tax=Bacillus sp. CGMCC 1.16607 TaxID=3351842 RepID=UPI00363BD761
MEWLYQNLFLWMNNNQLLKVDYIVPREGRKSLVGRLIQYSYEEQLFIFYLDDTKSVLSLHQKQIDKIESNTGKH